MSKYVIGVDGGGTKTEAVLAETTGVVVGKRKGGSTNYQSLGGERLKRELGTLLEALLNESGIPGSKVAHLFLGLAGVGREKDRLAVMELIKDSCWAQEFSVDSDAVIALAGAFANEPGIILIAGTGAICLGKNARGEIVRSGGWGYLLGDEGSGYFIGRQALIAALKDLDGRGDKTALRNQIQAKFNLNSIDEIIPLVYQRRIKIADIAPLVFDTAQQGDTIAQKIIREAGRELGKLAKAVAQRLEFADEEIQVALSGSIFNRKEMLGTEISKELYEVSWDIKTTSPLFDPVIGAVILALEKSGIPLNESILNNLRRYATTSKRSSQY